jgi:hypothetical protein
VSEFRNTWPGGIRRAISQDEHARHNASHYPGTRELCCVCDDETGRAGRGEDSIFREVLKTSCELFHDGRQLCQNVGDEVGPLCENCDAAMTELGFFPSD